MEWKKICLAISCRNNSTHIRREFWAAQWGRKTNCGIPSREWRWWSIARHLDKNWSTRRRLSNHSSPGKLEHKRSSGVDLWNDQGKALPPHLDWKPNNWVRYFFQFFIRKFKATWCWPNWFAASGRGKAIHIKRHLKTPPFPFCALWPYNLNNTQSQLGGSIFCLSLTFIAIHLGPTTDKTSRHPHIRLAWSHFPSPHLKGSVHSPKVLLPAAEHFHIHSFCWESYTSFH